MGSVTLEYALLDAEIVVLAAHRERGRRPWLCPCCGMDMHRGTRTAEQTALASRRWARLLIDAENHVLDEHRRHRLFLFEAAHRFPHASSRLELLRRAA